MIYHINRTLQLRFQKTEDLPALPFKASKCYPYSLFYCYDDIRMISYYVIANHHPEAKLIRDYRQADYFILIQGYLHEQELLEMSLKLTRIPDILAAFRINLDELKEFDHLVSDLEIHMIDTLKKIS